MKFSPDLFKAVDHCQHRSFITNKYTGARIAVDCIQGEVNPHNKCLICSGNKWTTKICTNGVVDPKTCECTGCNDSGDYRDWETDRKSTRLNSSHRSLSRMPSSA